MDVRAKWRVESFPPSELYGQDLVDDFTGMLIAFGFFLIRLVSCSPLFLEKKIMNFFSIEHDMEQNMLTCLPLFIYFAEMPISSPPN